MLAPRDPGMVLGRQLGAGPIAGMGISLSPGVGAVSSTIEHPGGEGAAVLNEPRPYLVCAWCEPGVASSVGHKICPRHRQELEAQRAAMDWRGK